MDGVAMEGPLPPLTKIDDDVEGVGVEVTLALKSMRCGRSCGGRVCEVGRFEQYDVMGDSVEVVGIDFSASLEASSLPRGSRSSDLRQLKLCGRRQPMMPLRPCPCPYGRSAPSRFGGRAGDLPRSS